MNLNLKFYLDISRKILTTGGFCEVFEYWYNDQFVVKTYNHTFSSNNDNFFLDNEI